LERSRVPREAFGALRARLCGLHSGYTGKQGGRALARASKQSQSVARFQCTARSQKMHKQGRIANSSCRRRRVRRRRNHGRATEHCATAMDNDEAVIAAEGAFTDAIRSGAGPARGGWVPEVAVRDRRRGRSEAGAFLKRPWTVWASGREQEKRAKQGSKRRGAGCSRSARGGATASAARKGS